MIVLQEEDKLKSEPLEWSPLWDSMNYYESTTKWTPTTEDMFHAMLNAVPPRATGDHAFLVGEPHHDNTDGETVYAALCKASDGQFYARYLTFKKFREVCRSASNS